MSTIVRMPIELKEKLEELKEKYNKKAIYDVVEYFIELTEVQQETIWNLQEEKAQIQQRREKEDIYLGEELKKQLQEFQSHVGLRRPADAIEFLIVSYDGAMSINKMAFDTYIRLKGGSGQ